MNASDYPINFPYGSSDPPYSTAHRHRGDDRPCPEGTPIVMDGVTIGLTGHTGEYQGVAYLPHLHIQEWQGDFANTREPQNSFEGGTVVQAGTLSEFGNYVTIQTSDGWNDSYCHLSKINVKVGDEVGMADKVDENMSRVLQHGILGRNGLDGRPNALAGQTDTPWLGNDLTAKFIMDIYNSPEAVQWRDNKPKDSTSIPGINEQLKNAQSTYVPVGQLFVKKV